MVKKWERSGKEVGKKWETNPGGELYKSYISPLSFCNCLSLHNLLQNKDYLPNFQIKYLLFAKHQNCLE